MLYDVLFSDILFFFVILCLESVYVAKSCECLVRIIQIITIAYPFTL